VRPAAKELAYQMLADMCVWPVERFLLLLLPEHEELHPQPGDCRVIAAPAVAFALSTAPAHLKRFFMPRLPGLFFFPLTFFVAFFVAFFFFARSRGV